MSSLFKIARPDVKRHASFEYLVRSPAHFSTRAMLNDAFERFPDKDKNFIEQFQGAGFDTRTFELYVSELLHATGFRSVGTAPYPDFVVEKKGTRIAIECTTANPSCPNPNNPYRPFHDESVGVDGVRRRSLHDVPVRFAGAIRNKMSHRVKAEGGLAYWELAEVLECPFVIAVQSFHEHGSLLFSGSAVASYLYGRFHYPEWDEDGRLRINVRAVESHQRSGREPIPSGFFDQPGSENVSAILWTNAGTIAKFARMGFEGIYPDAEVSAVRYGR